MLLWGYAHDSGDIIFRDFWYPYSGSIFLNGRNIQSIALLYIYKVIIFFCFGLILYNILDNKFIIATLILLLLIGGEQYYTANGLPMLWGLNRYILSIAIVLSYASAVGGFWNTSRVNYIIFNILLTIGLITYFDQILLAVVPIFCLSILYLIEKRGQINWVRIISLSLTPLLIIFSAALLAYNHGVLINLLDFYFNSSSNIIASTEPTTIIFSFKSFISYQSLIILIPAFFFGYSLYRLKETSLDGVERRFGYIYFGLSILTLMVLMKYSIRDMRYQVLVYPILLTLFYIYNKQRLNIVTSGVLIGILLNYLPNYIDNIYKNIFQIAPQILTNNIRNINEIKKFSDIPLADRYKFNESDIVEYSQLLELTDGANFYVFGEPSAIYVYGQRKIPYFISFYDGSSLKDQYKLIKNLNENNIDIILIRKSFTSFDLIENSVRVPQIFEYVIKNFSYFNETDNYLILNRTGSTRKPNYPMWQMYLGSEINLGYLPNLIKPTSIECNSTDKCNLLIRIRRKTALQDNFTVKLVSDLKNINVNFSMHPHKSEAYINYNRLWISNFIGNDISMKNILCDDTLISCDIIKDHEHKEILY